MAPLVNQLFTILPWSRSRRLAQNSNRFIFKSVFSFFLWVNEWQNAVWWSRSLVVSLFDWQRRCIQACVWLTPTLRSCLLFDWRRLLFDWRRRCTHTFVWLTQTLYSYWRLTGTHVDVILTFDWYRRWLHTDVCFTVTRVASQCRTSRFHKVSLYI